MPNWCYTQITISHDDQKEIDKLYNLIEEWTSKNYKQSDFGNYWLGNIVGNSGIDTWDGDFKIRCRGRLFDLNKSEKELYIATETAWTPMLRMWLKILEKYSPDAQLIYTAEEPGCCIYVTNNLDLKDKYIIDDWSDCYDYAGDEYSQEDVIKILQEITGNHEEHRFDYLMNEFSMGDYELSINPWEFVKAEEWGY